MLWNRIHKNAGSALMGFVAGVTLMLVLGFAEKLNEDEKEILPKNTFGDLRIITVPVERSDTNGGLAICKGEIPIIFLYTNNSNEVNRFGISNGTHGILALGCVGKSGISEFGVYGNEVHDGRRSPVLMMDASDKPGVWHKVTYAPTIAAVYDKDKLSFYRAVGEVYFDLDFDGQFDAKEICDDQSVVISQSIFIKGEWRELGRRDSNDRWKRLGGFDRENLSADTVDGGKKIYFNFLRGKGWQERSPEDGPSEASPEKRRGSKGSE